MPGNSKSRRGAVKIPEKKSSKVDVSMQSSDDDVLMQSSDDDVSSVVFDGIQGRDESDSATFCGKVFAVIPVGNNGARILTNRGWRKDYTSAYFEHHPGASFG